MNSRRARVQYGKASKRVNSHVSSSIVAQTGAEGSLASYQAVEQEPPGKRTVPQTGSVTQSFPDASENINTKESPKKKLNVSAPRPTFQERSTAPVKKRKRDISPPRAEPTEIIEVSRPASKAVRGMRLDSPSRTAGTPVTTSRLATPSRPSTPNKALSQTPKLTRDLSDLFISPHKPSGAGVAQSPPKPGHLKRMLSKSKTEPALEASNERRDLFPSKTVFSVMQTTLQNEPPTTSITNSSIPAFTSTPHSRDRTTTPPLMEARLVPRSPGKVGRTYSKSRSFLMEVPRESISMEVDDGKGKVDVAASDDPELQDIHRPSYAELRSRWGIDQSDHDPELNTPNNELNSIGEMRSRGEARRFLDEVGYLFEALDPSSGRGNTGARRASAIQIVSKMCEADFLRKAAASDIVGKAWSLLRAAGAGNGDDKIMDAALIAFVAISMKDSRNALDLHRQEDILPFLSFCLEISPSDDVLVAPPANDEQTWARRLGLSRMDRASLLSLRSAIGNGRILHIGQVASHRLLALLSVAKLTELERPLSASILNSIIASVTLELASPSYGTPVEAPTSSLQIIIISLQIAQKIVAGQPDILISETIAAQQELLPPLVRLINDWPAQYASQSLSLSDEDLSQIALQYLVTITHDSPELSVALTAHERLIHNLLRLFSRWYRESFPEPTKKGKNKKVKHEELKKTDEDEQSILLKHASLSLGLITQLVRHTSTASVVIQDTEASTTCLFRGACAEHCQCPHRKPGIELLVDIFERIDEGADDKADYFRGHLAILLGLLCLQDQQSRAGVLLVLKPAGASDDAKIKALAESVRGFKELLSVVVDRVSKAALPPSSPDGSEKAPEVRLEEAALDEGVQLADSVLKGLEDLID